MITKKSKIRKACSESDYLTVKTILNKGFDVNINYSDGFNAETLMDVAINSFDLRMINILIDNGFNLNSKSITPPLCSLIYSCNSQDEINFEKAKKIINRFMELGFNIDESKNHSGDTPLIIAARRNNSEIVQLLLELGANKKIEGYEGKRAIDVTNSQKIKDMLESDKILEKINKDGWHKLSKCRVAYVQNDIKLKRSITEVFNFSSKNGNVITTVTNLLTDSESSFKEYIKDYQDKEKLKEALDILGPISEKMLKRIEVSISNDTKENKSKFKIAR